jgi:hypothetical protein
MDGTLGSDWFTDFITGFCKSNGVSVLLAVDSEVRARSTPDAASIAALKTFRGSSTELGVPIRKLLETVDEIVAITDDDGLRSLQAVAHEDVSLPGLRAGARAVVCRTAIP